MAITVTATQGGSTANGMLLRVMVLTGAKTVAQQTGGSNSDSSNVSGQLSVTTTQTGSRVYGATLRASATAPTVNAITTQLDGVSDGTHVTWYGTWEATNLTGTPGATTFGYTATFFGDIAGLEILAAGTLAEDASAPASVNTTAATTVTTASFTPPPGSLLVALVSSNGAAAQTTMTLSDSSGLVWTEKPHGNVAGNAYAGVWIADVPAAGGGVSQARPGSTWLRRFHHRQQPGRPVPPAAAPQAGPPLYPLDHPVIARQQPQQGGHTSSRDGTFAQQGPPVKAAEGPTRARIPQPVRGGTVTSRDGTYAQAGPPARRWGAPVRARIPQPPRGGRVTARDGTYAQQGPPARVWDAPVQAKRYPLPQGGHTASRDGVYGQAGPPARVWHGPARAIIPAATRGGRTAGRAGVFTPPPVLAPAIPLRSPVRARIPGPVRKGSAQWTSVPQACAYGSGTYGSGPYGCVPAPTWRSQPVRARPPLPARGRTASRRGTFTFVATGAGPPVYPLGHPVQARRQPQQGGRTSSRDGTYGQAGPPVRPAAGPVKARPAATRGGRTASRAGTFTAGAPQAGPPVHVWDAPVQAKRQPVPGGRVVRRAGTWSGTGPPVRPLAGPVGVHRRQQPPPARGRISSARGPYAQTGPPVVRLRRPVRGQPQRPLLTGRADWRAGTYTPPFVPPFTIGALTATDAARATQAPTDKAANALTALTAPSSTITTADKRTGGPG